MLHALEPGHGKTAAAAYLVGARRCGMSWRWTSRFRYASLDFILGLLTLFASQYILPAKLWPWLGLGSGLIVVFIGLRIFLNCLRSGGTAPAHRHGSGHCHEYDHPHDHDHDHAHEPAICHRR